MKSIAKLCCTALLSVSVLGSGIFLGKTAYDSYGIHKKEVEVWSRDVSQYYKKKGQYYHPSKMKVMCELQENGNTDIYAYEPTFKSRFFFDLSYNLNKAFGISFGKNFSFKRITADKAVDKDPAYSSDGSRIAFSSDREGSFDIWIMSEDGKNETRITQGTGDETMPQWMDDKTLTYHLVKDENSFYEMINLEDLKVLEQVGIERGAFIGDRAFNFNLKGIDNKDYSLDNYLGKVVVLNFWSMYCGPCRGEIPHLKEFYKNRKEDVEVVSIVSDKKNKIEDFVIENEVTYPVLLDGEGKTFKDYLVRGVPATVLVDKKGKVAARQIGYLDFTSKEFNAVIEELSTK